jgi:hypothetical protein
MILSHQDNFWVAYYSLVSFLLHEVQILDLRQAAYFRKELAEDHPQHLPSIEKTPFKRMIV